MYITIKQNYCVAYGLYAIARNIFGFNNLLKFDDTYSYEL